jgi:hypothetical protein
LYRSQAVASPPEVTVVRTVPGKIALPVRRPVVKTSFVVGLVLGAASLLVGGLLVAFIWSLRPPQVAAAVPAAVATQPTAQPPATPVGVPTVAAVTSNAAPADGASTAESLEKPRDPFEEKVSLLRDAEERLTQLRAQYAELRELMFVGTLEEMAPPEFKQCVKEVARSGPHDLIVENLKKKVEEQDRRLAAKDPPGNDNGRSVRKGRFLLMVDIFHLQSKKPGSDVSRQIDTAIEGMNVTTELHEQERLIEPLRREVQALKARGGK